MSGPALAALAREIAACRACPRLVTWREEVALTRRRAFRDDTYWGKPVAGFGDAGARILVMGLAPAAHGANRTGRIFTGDRSGEFLFAALHRRGLASRPDSTHAGDGLLLRDVFLTLPCRCAPPANRPLPDELARCAPWLRREVDLLPELRVVIALGAVGYRATLGLFGVATPPAPPFRHGTEAKLARGPRTVVASYHVSQQNTQTGRLTAAMFDRVLARAQELAGP